MATFPVIGIINFEPVKQGATFKAKQFNIKRNGVNVDRTDAVYCGQMKRQANSSEIYNLGFETVGSPLDGNYRLPEFIASFPAYSYVWDLKIKLNTGEIIFPHQGVLPIITSISTSCQ